MIRLNSDHTCEELLKRWDEYTSVARFAGNDATMDLVFVAKRKGDKVRLVRKARSAHEPFSCVFRGRIKQSGQGSEIVGIFTKGIVDYIFVCLVWMFLFYIRSIVIQRGGAFATVNTLLAVALVGGIALLCNFRATKRKYIEFLSRVTDKDSRLFMSKRDLAQTEEYN